MRAWIIAATIVTASAAHQAHATIAGPPTGQGAVPRRSTTPPVVTAIEPPAGTGALSVNWIRIATPDLGAMHAAVARPAGAGPFPAVILLHGTHGFARQYVEWASDFAREGFIAVAGCWFSGGSGAGANAVSSPIPCPDAAPLGSGEYPKAVQLVEAFVEATGALADVRADAIVLVGHSRGAGATMQFLLAGGDVRGAVLHSSGYALAPWNRAADFHVPMLIMHGTADGPADGGGRTTRVELARQFEAALRRHQKPVEAAYCEGCGHNTFFSSATQRDAELQRMIDFLRRTLEE